MRFSRSKNGVTNKVIHKKCVFKHYVKSCGRHCLMTLKWASKHPPELHLVMSYCRLGSAN
jgi:hypothetical protein